MHRSLDEYLQHLLLAGKDETARGYRSDLGFFDRWLAAQRIDLLRATTDHLRAYQRHVAEEYRTKAGEPLSRGSQSCRLACVKTLYAWLVRRGDIVANVAEPIQLPRIPPGMVRSEHLSLQEATALLQTIAKRAVALPEGCARWAEEVRDLALFSLALASGRRRSGLLRLRVPHVDLVRNEVRCEREKGKAGRVLPVAPWVGAVLRIYIERARPVLNWHKENDALFTGDRGPRMGKNTVQALLQRCVERTVAANSDLDELAAKNITPHSLRVSFATLMFQGGANIRTINELMLHESLGTTARYTPIPLEDLRRACATAHPRA